MQNKVIPKEELLKKNAGIRGKDDKLFLEMGRKEERVKETLF